MCTNPHIRHMSRNGIFRLGIRVLHIRYARDVAMTTPYNERNSSLTGHTDEHFQAHFGAVTHELRDLLSTATRAMTVIKTRQVDPTGPTGTLLQSCLLRLRMIVDGLPQQGRLAEAMPVHQRLISVAQFIADVGFSAQLAAKVRGCTLKILPVDARLAMNVDRNMLFRALQNLLQSAFPLTAPGSTVRLSAYASANRIHIDIENRLVRGDIENLSQPHADVHTSGLQLGLEACRSQIEANDGELTVLNVPSSGCVVSIDLPRHLLSETFFRL